jgi:hypothetical protein
LQSRLKEGVSGLEFAHLCFDEHTLSFMGLPHECILAVGNSTGNMLPDYCMHVKQVTKFNAGRLELEPRSIKPCLTELTKF